MTRHNFGHGHRLRAILGRLADSWVRVNMWWFEPLVRAFNGEGRLTRMLNWVAHQVLPLCAITATLYAATWVGVPEIFADLALLDLCLALVVYSMHIELTRLCIDCMRAVPADGSVRARRLRLVLRGEHLKVSLLLGVLLGPGIVEYIVAPIRQHGGGDPGLWLLMVWILASAYSTVVHRRLRLWCPYCRRRGGGGGIPEPSPEPTLVGTRS